MIRRSILKSPLLVGLGFLLSLLAWTSEAGLPVSCTATTGPITYPTKRESPTLPAKSMKILNYTAVKITEMEVYYGNYLANAGDFTSNKGAYSSALDWQMNNQLAPHPATVDTDGNYLLYRVDPMGMNDNDPIVKTFKGPLSGSGAVTDMSGISLPSFFDLSININKSDESQCWSQPASSDVTMSIYMSLQLGELHDECVFYVSAAGAVKMGGCATGGDIIAKSLFFVSSSAITTGIDKQLVIAFGCALKSGGECPLIPLYSSVHWGTGSSPTTGKTVRDACQNTIQNTINPACPDFNQ